MKINMPKLHHSQWFAHAMLGALLFHPSPSLADRGIEGCYGRPGCPGYQPPSRSNSPSNNNSNTQRQQQVQNAIGAVGAAIQQSAREQEEREQRQAEAEARRQQQEQERQRQIGQASGLVYESLKEGSGESPKATDIVKLYYKGWLPDGKVFDSASQNGGRTEYPLNRVLPCWTEGVQRMKPGGKARLTCPPAIAFGAEGVGGLVPPNATVYYEVELISVRR